MKTFQKIYLDYAASTPVDKRVLEAMKPYFNEKYGNPGSLHSFGQEAVAAIDLARETIAGAIGAKFEEIVFTGSATEANNLALRGTVKAARFFLRGAGDSFKNQARENVGSFRSGADEPPKIIVSAIEHESVLETAHDLEKEGVEVVVLPVSSDGFVDLEKLKAALDERTVLVSVMYANNEIGTIQPIAEIAEIIKNHKLKNKNYPLFHTDAVQAFQYLNCNVDKLGVDLMTLSAHKIYGPKGIGALYVRNNELGIMNYGNEEPVIHNSKFIIQPLVTGGGQEFGLRSGTENVPSIVGFAKAVALAAGLREKEARRISNLRHYFWRELKKIYPTAEANGIMNKKTIIHNSSFILPNILNVYFPAQKAEDLLVKFDQAGIAVSSGSACRTRSAKPSHVLQALGLKMERVKSSIRFSLGRFVSKEEIEETLRRINKIFEV